MNAEAPGFDVTAAENNWWMLLLPVCPSCLISTKAVDPDLSAAHPITQDK